MVDDKKLKVLKEYFLKRRDGEKHQLTPNDEQVFAVASLHKAPDIQLSEMAYIALHKKSKKSNISFNTLKEVYCRGYSAWKNNHVSTHEQAGFARVNSYVNKGITYHTDDKDLHEAVWSGYKKKNILDKPTMNAQELAKKHKVYLDIINKEIERGVKIEKEHTSDEKIANEIARDHIGEDPKYYEKLKTAEKKTVSEDTPTNSAGGGSVRGMGYVSGDPNGQPPAYQTGNVIDSDQRNNVLFKLIKQYHTDLHNKKPK